MALQDFLNKAKDRKITSTQLDRYWRDLMSRPLAKDNLDAGERDFVYEIIKKYRKRYLNNERSSASDLERAYYQIYEKRHELKLEKNDLQDIKEVIYSFKD